jgi:yecA family protein
VTAKKTRTTEQLTFLGDIPTAVRERAFKQLVEFAKNRQFAPSVRAAYDEFWSDEFGQRSEAAKAAAFARSEAEGGFITYCLLDAARAGGGTIAEMFLAQRGEHLPRREREYLERLAGTRMGLYEVAVVDRGRGLTLVDLWNGDRIEVRERLLTYDVLPASVVAVRTFPALDGATELDGTVYSFPRRQAEELLAILRGEWEVSRKKEPSLSQERFLKRRAGPVINRYWFDNVFFEADGRTTVEEFVELGEFLGHSSVPNVMDLSGLHGFLCAIACGPVLVRPSRWLPLVWGDVAPTFESDEQAERIVSLIFELNKHVLYALEEGSFQPLLPESAPAGSENVAQSWCTGFMRGVLLGGRAWDVLFKDTVLSPIVTPILVLAYPRELVDDPADDPEATANLVKMLPLAVKAIASYWRSTPSTRTKATRATGGRNRRAPTALPAPTAGAARVHRLKIELTGVKPPVWRRVEIASDAKLPLVSRVLLASMGWMDTHLHAFEVGRTRYGVRDPEFPDDTRSERSVTLADIAPNPKDRFMFDYDFGDGWRHRVTVEAIIEASEADLPRCIAGARACPPEDCGGTYGYAELLEVLADATHDEHERMREWAPENFDPGVFDLAGTNQALRRLVRRRRARLT